MAMFHIVLLMEYISLRGVPALIIIICIIIVIIHVSPKNSNNNNDNDKNDYENKEFIINDQLLLETILMMIRGETIKYSAYRKRNRLKKKHMEKDIINIEAKFTNMFNEITEDEINILEEKCLIRFKKN